MDFLQIGPFELLLILVLAFLLLGSDGLGDAAKRLGKTIHDVRQGMSDLTSSVSEAKSEVEDALKIDGPQEEKETLAQTDPPAKGSVEQEGIADKKGEDHHGHGPTRG